MATEQGVWAGLYANKEPPVVESTIEYVISALVKSTVMVTVVQEPAAKAVEVSMTMSEASLLRLTCRDREPVEQKPAGRRSPVVQQSLVVVVRRKTLAQP